MGPAAAFVVLEWERTVGLYNSGFHPDRAALAPGLVLLVHVIEDAILRGKRRFDFLRGEERYKYEFGPTPEEVFSVRIGPARARGMSLRVAMLSVHTCPLAALGGKETGGMNVYVRELSRELGADGPRRRRLHALAGPDDPPRGPARRGRARRAPSGRAARRRWQRERIHDHLDEFVDGVEAWRHAHGVEYDLVHAHYWLSGVVGLALRERWGVPVLQMFHTLGRFKNGAARRLARPRALACGSTRSSASSRQVDGLVAASAVERRALIDEYGADPARATVIPCGVDTELFRPGDRDAARAPRSGADDAPLVLYVGPHRADQGARDAARRDRAAPRARLPRCGCSSSAATRTSRRTATRPTIRRRADALGLRDVVRFVGAQPQDVLRDYYVAADVTVLPSYYESFGMVALEAMACGSPVIGSRVGGLATTVRDGVTGLPRPRRRRDGARPSASRPCSATPTFASASGARACSGRRGTAGPAWPRRSAASTRGSRRAPTPHLAAARCHE